MTQEETLKRIEQDAHKFSESWGENCDRICYVAGAKSERNKVLDEVSAKLNSLVEFGFLDVPCSELTKILTSLKVDL